MYINKISLSNNSNKVGFKQNKNNKHEYIYVDQSSVDNYKLPLGMGLIYSQFEFNRPDKEVKDIFKQKLVDFKSKTFAKKCKSMFIPALGAVGLALACEYWGFKKQLKVKKKNNVNDETTLKQGLLKKGIFETIMVSSIVAAVSDYTLKNMKNREKAMDKTLAATGITMALWGTLSLISAINTFKNYKKEKNQEFLEK